MTKRFECAECGEPAYEDEGGITRHGMPGAINFNADEQHTPLDPSRAALVGVDSAGARREAADRAFEAYDFGDITVEDADGWESATPGTELSRKIYLARDGSESERAYFTVRSDRVDSIGGPDPGLAFLSLEKKAPPRRGRC